MRIYWPWKKRILANFEAGIRSNLSIIPLGPWLTVHERRITGERVIWPNAQVQNFLHYVKCVHEYIVHCSNYDCALLKFMLFIIYIVHFCEQH